jgi:uncharacterized damage-inducible protein DinB
MDATSRASLWDQFGATIDMLENAIRACPDGLWSDAERQPQFWHVAFHTLFYLDLYLSESSRGFAPPAPFTLTELDPSGTLPERVYSKTEVLAYLEHGRRKARARINGLRAENATQRCEFDWINLGVFESLLYNMRHVQHHAAQLNLLLRQANHPVPRWVSRSG